MSGLRPYKLTLRLKRQQHDGLRNVPAPPAMGRDHLNAMFAKLSPQDPHDSAPKQQDVCSGCAVPLSTV